MDKKPLGIYLHIPFCVQKCLYCDFLSGRADGELIQNYVNAMLREIELEAGDGRLDDYEADTVFFGGGTPSLLSVSQVDKILCKLSEKFSFREGAEITLEMNPGTVSESQLAALRACGINRISVGVQSLQDSELAALGRIHRAQDVLRMWEWTQKAGFQNRNIDLMTGIPGQTEESLYDTLQKTLQLGPEHISAYSLIVEEGTPFAGLYPEGAVDEETDRRLYALTGEVLFRQGYERYEISNYAREGFLCRHNRSYWTRGEYLGFGIGAASLLRETRFRNTTDLKSYVNLAGTCSLHEEVQVLSVRERMEETMFLGLRLAKGVSKKDFSALYGVSMESVYAGVIQKHKREGLLGEEDGRIFLTKRGMDVSNYVMADFLLENG